MHKTSEPKFVLDSELKVWVSVIVLTATFNNISVICWWSVLLVVETPNLSQVIDNIYHIMLYQVYLAMSGTHSVSVDRN